MANLYSGQLHADTVYSFMRHSLFSLVQTDTKLFVESMNTCEVPISFMANFQISECPRSIPLEAYSMDDALVNVDGVFSGPYRVDGRTALLPPATLL